MKEASVTKITVISVVSGILLAALLLTLGNSGNIPWFPPPVVFTLVAVSLLVSISFPLLHRFYLIKRIDNSGKVYSYLYAFARYCIAFNIAAFGWKKILGLQFVVPQHIASIPMNEQSGEWLTWYYFGYSPTFGFIIAVLQITGSYMLLFRKTFLVGLVILLPLMLNIALVDIFYDMNLGALIQAVVLTSGLLFLLTDHYHGLVRFFVSANLNLPAVTINDTFVKNTLRLSAIILSLLFTIYIKYLVNH